MYNILIIYSSKKDTLESVKKRMENEIDAFHQIMTSMLALINLITNYLDTYFYSIHRSLSMYPGIYPLFQGVIRFILCSGPIKYMYDTSVMLPYI